MNTFTPNPALIDTALATRAHSGTSMIPDERGAQEITAFVDDIESVYADLCKFSSNEAEMDIVDTEMTAFQLRYAELFTAKLRARSSCVSTMIAGPSNFNVGGANKANTSYDRRYEEMITYRNRAIATIKKKITAHRIDEAGGESEIMKAKIADAEQMQILMKGCNKICRAKKPSDEEKASRMIEEFKLSADTVREIMAPDYMGRIGFATYQLTNNNANIKRMKSRVIELQAKEDTPTSEIEFNGGSIIDNAEDDRVQIDFDDKPDDAMLAKLRGAGWRYAPSRVLWQRKRTLAAMQSAKQIVGATA